MPTGHRLVVGCGYLGARVAQAWRQKGDTVWAVTRNPQRAERFAAEGWRPIVADVTKPESLGQLPACDSVLMAVTLDRQQHPDRAAAAVDALRNVCQALPRPPRRFIQISSTSVYGQVDGQWVDERSPTEPTSPGGRACLAAEQWLNHSPLRNSAIVLRLAGIYGPGRLPRLADVRSGVLAVDPHGFVNLIHVEDAVAAVLAVDELTEPPELYVVADGRPVRRGEYLQYLAELAGLGPVECSRTGAEVQGRRGAEHNKRVRSARIVEHCQIHWKFPSYREGLRDAAQAGVG